MYVGPYVSSESWFELQRLIDFSVLIARRRQSSYLFEGAVKTYSMNELRQIWLHFG